MSIVHVTDAEKAIRDGTALLSLRLVLPGSKYRDYLTIIDQTDKYAMSGDQVECVALYPKEYFRFDGGNPTKTNTTMEYKTTFFIRKDMLSRLCVREDCYDGSKSLLIKLPKRGIPAEDDYADAKAPSAYGMKSSVYNEFEFYVGKPALEDIKVRSGSLVCYPGSNFWKSQYDIPDGSYFFITNKLDFIKDLVNAIAVDPTADKSRAAEIILLL